MNHVITFNINLKLTHEQVVEYIATQLIDGYKAGDNATTTFLNKYDFFIIPFVNPDGRPFPDTMPNKT